jgi:hypothetical protein
VLPQQQGPQKLQAMQWLQGRGERSEDDTLGSPGNKVSGLWIEQAGTCVDAFDIGRLVGFPT